MKINIHLSTNLSLLLITVFQSPSYLAPFSIVVECLAAILFSADVGVLCLQFSLKINQLLHIFEGDIKSWSSFLANIIITSILRNYREATKQTNLKSVLIKVI